MAGKLIYQTKEVKEFANAMSVSAFRKYNVVLQLLKDTGVLSYPLAEKVEGRRNLFEIRILSEDNESFFYCYDTGTVVYVIHAFEKKTRKTPPREIEKALAIRRRLLGN